jgi:hypothetical protein
MRRNTDFLKSVGWTPQIIGIWKPVLSNTKVKKVSYCKWCTGEDEKHFPHCKTINLESKS